jgi:hypothetical protein
MQAYRKTLANSETQLVVSPDNKFLRSLETGE